MHTCSKDDFIGHKKANQANKKILAADAYESCEVMEEREEETNLTCAVLEKVFSNQTVTLKSVFTAE